MTRPSQPQIIREDLLAEPYEQNACHTQEGPLEAEQPTRRMQSKGSVGGIHSRLSYYAIKKE